MHNRAGTSDQAATTGHGHRQLTREQAVNEQDRYVFEWLPDGKRQYPRGAAIGDAAVLLLVDQSRLRRHKSRGPRRRAAEGAPPGRRDHHEEDLQPEQGARRVL